MVVLSVDGKKVKISYLDLQKLKNLAHPIRIEILNAISENPKYASNIAKELKISPQLVNFHLKNLEKEGLIRRVKGHANLSFFETDIEGFLFLTEKGKKKLANSLPTILEGFIDNGYINCKLVVGSTYPSKDKRKIDRTSYLSGEIAAFLGNYGILKERLVYFDTEIRNFKENFIILSGPLANKLTDLFNKYLPIRFLKDKRCIYSEISNLKYSYSNTGIIVKTKNPFAPDKNILILAGGDGYGTKIVVYTLLNYYSQLSYGNYFNEKQLAKVVRGEIENGKVKKVWFLE